MLSNENSPRGISKAWIRFVALSGTKNFAERLAFGWGTDYSGSAQDGGQGEKLCPASCPMFLADGRVGKINLLKNPLRLYRLCLIALSPAAGLANSYFNSLIRFR